MAHVSYSAATERMTVTDVLRSLIQQLADEIGRDVDVRYPDFGSFKATDSENFQVVFYGARYAPMRTEIPRDLFKDLDVSLNNFQKNACSPVEGDGLETICYRGIPILQYDDDHLYILFDLAVASSSISELMIAVIQLYKQKPQNDAEFELCLKKILDLIQEANMQMMLQGIKNSLKVKAMQSKSDLTKVEERLKELQVEAAKLTAEKRNLKAEIAAVEKTADEYDATDAIEVMLRRVYQRFGRENFKISGHKLIYTHPKTILYKYDKDGKTYDLGEFEIHIDLADGKLSHKIYSKRKPSNIDYHHPHISSSGETCLGNAQTPVDNFSRKYDLVNLISSLVLFINSYSDRIPFVSIEKWPVYNPLAAFEEE